MAVTEVVSLLVLVVSAQGSVGPSSNNSLCTESRECLQYQLLCQTDEYEVRHYSPTLWVSTDAEAYFMGVGAAMAFRRLFQYITGDNEGGYQIDMTAPVLVKIPEETTMWEPAIYTLSFPLPQAYQEKPPQPTNDKLYFTEMPDMDVYVRSYGGWMLSVTSRLQAHQLTKELDRVGAKYNCTHHYGVGYDSPLKLLNRHNEVWYVCEGKPVCTDPQEPTPPHPLRPRTDDPAQASPSGAPSTSSSQPPEDSPVTGANSSSLPLPLALSLSAAIPSPSEESTLTNSSTSEQITQSTPASSEENTQETSNTAEASTRGTTSPASEENNSHTNFSISEQVINSTPTLSEEKTQGTNSITEDHTQGTSNTAEDHTHSSPSPSEDHTHGTPEPSEQKTQSGPSFADKSTHSTPVTTEKSI